MNVDRWKSQLRKGAAELAILAMLEEEAASGISLLERLKGRSEIGLSAGTIYPLLNRLERDHRIEGQWQIPDDGSRPTKHYTLTKDGKKALGEMRIAWVGFREELSEIAGDA
jgi:PadR family transcriptional regulator PadR